MNTRINHKVRKLVKVVSPIYLFALLPFFSSCADFLEIKPQNEIILEDFWSEKADVDNVVAGCYSRLLDSDVRERMMIWGEVRSDNIMSGQNINNNQDLYNVLKVNITAKNKYTAWDGFYDVINRCNTVLKYAPEVARKDPAFTESDLRATVAEVSALRDLCYFYLIRTFRDVPYTTEAFTDDDQKMDLPATPFYSVLDSLITDLEHVKGDAVVRYPETKPRYQTGRITREAIYAMLCEMYLWKKDYDNCINYAELVIKSKKDYEEEQRNLGTNRLSTSAMAVIDARLNGYPLVYFDQSSSDYGSIYDEVFGSGMSKESIFELMYDDDPQSNGMTANSAISSFYGNSTNPKGLLSPSARVMEDISKTENREIFEVKKNLDGRMYWNCDPEEESITKYAARSVSISISDNNTMTSSSLFPQNSNSTKWIIYRLPDIMLLEAEALCQKMREGSDASVDEYNLPLRQHIFSLVNAVNKRSICKQILADKDTLKFNDYTTKTLLENLVMKERHRELMFEGKRWYDLVRYSMRENNTQTLLAAVLKNGGGDFAGDFVANFLKKMDAIFWPYNYDELKVNHNLEPNPAFNSGESKSYEKTN